MWTRRRLAAGVVLGLVVALALAAWHIQGAENPTGAIQVSREAGGSEAITLSVTRASEALLDQPGIGQDLSGMKGRVMPFAITADTHGGHIGHLDLNGKVLIRDAYGMEIPGIVRQLSVDDHHTTYVAVFPQVDSHGLALADPAQKELRMVVRDVGTVKERVFAWSLRETERATGSLGIGRFAAGAVALAAILGGFLALLSPCVLHTSSYWAVLVTGSSAQAGQPNAALSARRAGIVKVVLLYIAGFTVMYVTLGTLAGAVGSIASHTLTETLAPYKIAFDVAAGALMVLFGLQVLGLLRGSWAHRLRIPVPRSLLRKLGSADRPTAFTMGLSMAIGCVTCVGGTVFLGLLAYLGTTTWYTGLQVSLLYSLGLAIPLLLLTFGLGHWLLKLRMRPLLYRAMAVASGGGMAAIGLLTLVGQGELVETGLFWLIARVGGG